MVGDIIKLENGGRVPADCRVLESQELLVDKSSLNGESKPFRIEPAPSSLDTDAIQAHCLAFNGSPICQGQALGLVIRTGDSTYIGNVARLTNVTRGGQTTFEREVHAFVKIVSGMAFSMAIAFYIVGIVRGHFTRKSFIDNLINGFVVIVVANIPQGIPATVTSLLTIAAK